MPGEVEVVSRLFGVIGLKPGDEIDLAALFGDPDAMGQAAPWVADDAAVEFMTPDGGDGFGPMGGPFVGLAGLRAGWTEWLGAWESFRGRIEEIVEIGDGRVLVLAHALGRMRGSGFELDTPSAMLFTVRDGVMFASSTSSTRSRPVAWRSWIRASARSSSASSPPCGRSFRARRRRETLRARSAGGQVPA